MIALGAVNILFVLSIENVEIGEGVRAAASWLFIVGAFTMPVCCFLSAWRERCRILFPIPVLALIGGAAIILYGLVTA